MSQPVHQHAYETAVAAQEHGVLCNFVTGLYWKDEGVSARLLRLLPRRTRNRVHREYLRRWHPELDRELVHTISRYHVTATIFRRVLGRRVPQLAARLETKAHERFDVAVARYLRRSGHRGIVHAFEGAALETFRVAKQRGLKTILDVPAAHEYYKQVTAEEGGDNSYFDTIRVHAERGLADYCLVPSQYVARCLTEHGVPSEKIVQIPYGVDPRQFRPRRDRPDSHRFQAIFVGRIGLRKGVRYLLEAWALLSLPNAELVLVGTADKAGKELLHRYRDICRWDGAVPHHEIEARFSGSDVFVFPSLAEGSAYVTYEALASGLPVVTTPNSGSVVEDEANGFIVPPRDTEALADRIRLLYEQPELRQEMAKRARASIEQSYTWSHYRGRLGSFYGSLAAGTPRDASRRPSGPDTRGRSSRR